MEKQWKVKAEGRTKKRHFPELEKATEKILINKGFKSEQELETFFVPDYEKDLHDPFLLNDMEKAVERIKKADKKKEKICIFGDYDADGVTASTLLASFLKDQLKMDVFVYIPDREEEGYGLSEKALDFISDHKAGLIITVDCGITNLKETEYAKKKGMDVIILDHHNVIGKIPRALAVIDPKNPQEKKYPFKALAGVGVAFKLLQALTQKKKNLKKDILKWYLDLVAVGTIADCVPLIGENRILVRFGLMVLAKTKRAGFRQLFQGGRIPINENEVPSANQVAFQVAPRINAAGRMKHAQTAYELLMEKNELKAKQLAMKLENQNQERQKKTNAILKEIKKDLGGLEKIPKAIIKTSPQWGVGIIGLSAGKLTEEYARPVLLLQEKEDFYRGSGRSIPGFNLVKALEKQKKLLRRYGGHDQAAGLSVNKNNFKEFEKKFLEYTKEKIPKKIVKTVWIDAKLEAEEVNEKLCEQIQMLEPFGKENEMPILLLEKAEIVSKKLLGNGEKHLKLWIKQGESGILQAIGFGFGENAQNIKVGDKIDLLFNLEENHWNGNKELQLRIVDYKKSK